MYDYVIVGAGSAGCVLASRLTRGPGRQRAADRGRSAGHEREHPRPARLLAAVRTRRSTGTTRPRPEPFADRRRIHLPRGKTLGGSSSINAMVYIRGNRADYDEWRDGGCAGWGYDDLLPYFMRAEDNERGASRVPRRRAARWPCREGRSRNPITEAFLRGLRCRPGCARNEDFNGAEQDGFGRYQVTQRDGQALLAPRSPTCTRRCRRPNLTVDAVHAGPSRAVRGRRARSACRPRGSASCTSSAPSAR